MVKVYFAGRMEGFIMGIGTMGNNMEKVSILQKITWSSMGYGKMVKGLSEVAL